MRIVVVHAGSKEDFFPLMSLLIGLHKQYKDCKVTWVGDSKLFDLVKYNRRVNRCIPIAETSSMDQLKSFFAPDLLINPSKDKQATNVATIARAASVCGFTNSGATDRNAAFFDKVFYGNLKTNRHVLDLFYSLANLKWQGEGYGMPYYPKTKQTKTTGIYTADEKSFQLPERLLNQIDVLNQFSEIVTDDLFVCHAGISLRKKVNLITDSIPYQICFFGNGSQKTAGRKEEIIVSET